MDPFGVGKTLGQLEGNRRPFNLLTACRVRRCRDGSPCCTCLTSHPLSLVWRRWR